MTPFDIALLIILLGFVFFGFFYGLIRALGSLFGIVVGAWVAGHYFLLVSTWLTPFFFGYNNLGKVIIFLVLFGLVNRLVVLLFVLLDQAFNIIAIIPFLKSINRLAGALLGFFGGALVLGLIIYVASRYAIIDHFVGQWLIDSKIAPYLLKVTDVLLPLLPEVLKKIQSIIPS